MRDFFIRSFERLIGAIIILGAIAVVIFAIIGAVNAATAAQAIMILVMALVGGGLYLILVGGVMYLALGIYHNTMRTADLLEARGRQV